MQSIKTVSEWMVERGMDVEQLVQASALERRVVEAIIQRRYTPSPQQRQRLASALDVVPEQILWGHTAPVESLYGHGPQFGRTP